MARDPERIAELRRTLGARLATFRTATGLTQGQLAALAYSDRTRVTHIEKGRSPADEQFWRIADEACQAEGILLAAFRELETVRAAYEHEASARELAGAQAKAADLRRVRNGFRQPVAWPTTSSWFAETDEHDALELMRRVASSDVGDETLTRLEAVVDELAIAYPSTPPIRLLGRIRQHVAYVHQLLDGRMTLAEHRRLLVLGGWLSLLAATVQIDLKQEAAATARLKTAASLASHAGHNEIRAWCFETEAWRVLTHGDYPRAVELSRAAQAMAPIGSSVAVQAAAQEGRAWARLKQSRETYATISKVDKLVSPLPRPDEPEHHYRYDPGKSVAFTATTLAWLGDPAAEPYAREIIATLTPSDDVTKWPRRMASANIDLSLALLVTNRLDEACDATLTAISSGRVVPSNHWRAAEVVKAVEARGLQEAVTLRDAYEEMCAACDAQ